MININFIQSCLIKRWPDQQKLRIIYSEGKRKLDQNLDLLQIIKDIRFMKTVQSWKRLLSEKEEIQIEHYRENLIHVDEIMCHGNHNHSNHHDHHVSYNPIDQHNL